MSNIFYVWNAGIVITKAFRASMFVETFLTIFPVQVAVLQWATLFQIFLSPV